MNRYAPELALVAGVVLGGAFGGFVLITLGEFYSAAVVCALCSYPFAAYAIHTDDEPSTVLPPKAVTVTAGIAAAGVLADSIRQFGSTVEAALLGSLLAVGVFLPAAAYAGRYGEPPSWVRPRLLEGGCVLLAGLLLAGSLLTGAAAGAVSAVVVFVAGVVYGTRSTTHNRPRRRRWFPLAGLTVAGGLLAVGVLTGGPLDRWVTAGLAAVFGPLIAAAITTPT